MVNVLGATIDIQSLVAGAVIVLVIFGLIYSIRRFASRKSRKSIDEIKKSIKEAHESLVLANKATKINLIKVNRTLQDLYSFFNRVEARK